MTVPQPCPFCSHINNAGPEWADSTSLAIPDGFPLNPGHTLVAPRRHVADLFGLAPDEQADVWRLVAKTKSALQAKHRPDAFTIGVNIGTAAGQTVDHAHVHVIPRFNGDVPDPRGGVRWVIPSRAPYWESR